MVANSLEEVQSMYEAPRMMKGIKPQTYIDAAEAEALKEEEIAKLAQDGNEEVDDLGIRKTRIIQIPDDLFNEFESGVEDDKVQIEFKNVAFYTTIMFVAELNDDMWALMFPDTIDTTGRRLLHEVANYFDFAHHSQGKKKRKMLMYPRSQFISKQMIELKRLNREALKIQNKLAYRE